MKFISRRVDINKHPIITVEETRFFFFKRNVEFMGLLKVMGIKGISSDLYQWVRRETSKLVPCDTGRQLDIWNVSHDCNNFEHIPFNPMAQPFINPMDNVCSNILKGK